MLEMKSINKKGHTKNTENKYTEAILLQTLYKTKNGLNGNVPLSKVSPSRRLEV